MTLFRRKKKIDRTAQFAEARERFEREYGVMLDRRK